MSKIETELDAARAIADGTLPSPYTYGNVTLFAMRITGTGTAYRSKDDEFVYRPPEQYMNQEFLDRCNGLPVIFHHPEKSTLNSKEFEDRIVGVIMLSYLLEEEKEVWGIARVYDDFAIELMKNNQLSTSPAVVFKKLVDSDFIELHDGKRLLIEGKPILIDHLAICDTGVWDKLGEPTGILLTGGSNMTPEEEAKAKADAAAAEEKAKADAAKADSDGKLDKILAMADSLSKRMDAFEEKAKADATSDEDKEKEAKAKADAAEAEEKAKADAAAKADSDNLKERLDSLENALPKSDSEEDYAEMADSQAKADAVYGGFGKSAPAPLRGETGLAYRKRLANGLKALGSNFKTIDLAPIPAGAAFDVLEGQIYSDAQSVAANPTIPEEEGLREIQRKDKTGRVISEFKGSINSFTSEFRSPSLMGKLSSNRGAV